jgi:hypothetical protein
LFSYEREAVDRIPLRRPITIKRRNGKGSRIVVRQNPYLVNYLKARYQIYKNSLQQTNDGKYLLDVDQYAKTVREWYTNNHYLDMKGLVSPWSAIRDYEDKSRNADPDNDWWNYPDELRKKGKSHHPISEAGRQRERERRKLYRANKKQRELNA